MKPISQTKNSLFFSDGTRLTYGNCLVACIASILEEPIYIKSDSLTEDSLRAIVID